MKKTHSWHSYGVKPWPCAKFLIIVLLAATCAACKKTENPSADNGNTAAQNPLQTDWISGHAYIAVGNTATSRLEIYNPDAANWNTPTATFKPSTTLGFSATGSALFTGPTDAKVHYSSVWPNATSVMAITDNGWIGLAVWEGTSPRGYKIWGKYWSSNSPNIHSGELLPNGNMAIASTNATYGNWVRVYNTSVATGSNYAQFNLRQAHAVTWDPKYNVLWTCGDTQAGSGGKGILTALIVGGTRTAPTLTEDVSKRDTTPGRYPHEVSPYFGNKDKLLISDGSGVYIYDKINKTFTAVPGAANRTNVKGISNQPDNSYLVETRPDPCCSTTDWHTNSVQFYNPSTGALAKQFVVSGAAFYKATCFTRPYQ